MSAGNKVIKFERKRDGKNYDEKELISAMSVVGYRAGKLDEVLDCRCYKGRSASASTIYASLYVYGVDTMASGNGTAGGGGYHKSSAAVGCAIRSAGITLQDAIDGRGDTAIMDALTAIARHLGYKNTIIVRH